MTATRSAESRLFSDMHKDAYGRRPGQQQWANWATMNDAQLDAEEDRLNRAIESSEAEDRLRETDAAHRFELQVTDLMEAGAKDRATALRWMRQAEGISDDEFSFYGWSYVEYSFGLAYGYLGGRDA